jgi:RimJ/RimL family protein N-acetyltransferase
MEPTASLLDLPDFIETKRLLLRSPMPGDGPGVNEAVLETWDALHHWMPWARERPTVQQSEALVRQFRANFILRSDLPMFMFLRDCPVVVVGATRLHPTDWSVPRFDIGAWVRRRFEGQGFVSEAFEAVTRFAFFTLKAERLDLHCSHRNTRSQRLADQCGFVFEGRLRNQRREPSGELADTLVYSLVPTDPRVQALAG